MEASKSKQQNEVSQEGKNDSGAAYLCFCLDSNEMNKLWRVKPLLRPNATHNPPLALTYQLGLSAMVVTQSDQVSPLIFHRRGGDFCIRGIDIFIWKVKGLLRSDEPKEQRPSYVRCHCRKQQPGRE